MLLSLLFAAAILMCSILLSSLSNRVGMPVLLLFLGIGMLVGQSEIGQLLAADTETAFLIGNLALAIILLDGGMRTRAATFRVGLRPALSLATLGVLITGVVTGLAAMVIFDLPLLHGLLVGTIVSSTDAAAVFALMQNQGLRLNQRVSATLEIESGSNDPMAIFLTIMLVELVSGDVAPHWSDALLLLLKQVLFGGLGGWLGGLLLAELVKRIRLQPAFYPLLVTATGLTLFSAVALIDGSGFLAIYLMGVVAGNRGIRNLEEILHIHDGLAWLSQLCLFLTLGLLLNLADLSGYVLPGVLLGAVLILVARPLSIAASLWPFGFRWEEQLFISWVGLRGAVPIVLALFPLMAGVEHAELFLLVAFVIVILSLLVQGTTLTRVARALKLELPAAPQALQKAVLDWGDGADHRLMIFELDGEHWTPARTLSGIRLPEGVVLSALLRDGELISYKPELKLQSGDRLAIIGREPDELPLAKLFSSKASIPALRENVFFGSFELNGDVSLADLKQGMGVSVDEALLGLSLQQYIIEQLPNRPIVGDRVALGPLTLVVKEMDGERILRVGMKF